MSVGLFSQIICLVVCLYIPLFFKERPWFYWKFSRDHWRALFWWSKCKKLFFDLLLSPGELFWVIFCPFVCFVAFSMFLFFLRTIQLLHIIFCRCCRHYSEYYLFTASSPPLGAILWYFGSHFGVCSSVFGICSPSYLMEFLQMLLYYSDSHCNKRNFIAYIPLLGALCKIFGPIFGYLEKYETFS